MTSTNPSAPPAQQQQTPETKPTVTNSKGELAPSASVPNCGQKTSSCRVSTWRLHHESPAATEPARARDWSGALGQDRRRTQHNGQGEDHSIAHNGQGRHHSMPLRCRLADSTIFQRNHVQMVHILVTIIASVCSSPADYEFMIITWWLWVYDHNWSCRL
jgi:hypothetical protein